MPPETVRDLSVFGLFRLLNEKLGLGRAGLGEAHLPGSAESTPLEFDVSYIPIERHINGGPERGSRS